MRWMIWIVASLCAVASGQRFVMQDPEEVAARMIAPFGLAGNHGDLEANPFGFAYGVGEPGGYERFFREEVDLAIARGYGTVLLHRWPGEPTAGDEMDLDSIHHLRGSAWEFVIEEFRAALYACHERNPGVVFILYYGHDEQHLRGMFARGEHERFVRYLFECYEIALDADFCDIGCDASTRWDDDPASETSPYAAHIRMLQSLKFQQDRTVYIEAAPDPKIPGREWQANFPAIVLTPVFWNNWRLEREGRPGAGARRIEGGGQTTVHWYGAITHRDANLGPKYEGLKIHEVFTPVDAMALALLSESVTPAMYREAWRHQDWKTDPDPADWVAVGIHESDSPDEWVALGLRRVSELFMLSIDVAPALNVFERLEWVRDELRYLPHNEGLADVAADE